jgi:ribosome maturation factor RimP
MGETAEIDFYDKVKKATRDLMDGLALELVDAEIAREGGQLFLRIYIERDGGVTLDDCAKANGLIGNVLEREAIIADSYVLEVMSPGIYRRLKRPEEFEMNLGKMVRVRLKMPFEGIRDFSGVLVGAGEDSLTLELGEELLELRYDNLSGVRLEPQLPW